MHLNLTWIMDFSQHSLNSSHFGVHVSQKIIGVTSNFQTFWQEIIHKVYSRLLKTNLLQFGSPCVVLKLVHSWLKANLILWPPLQVRFLWLG